MAHRIVGVEPSGPAGRAGIVAGDELIAIGGEIVVDFIDYQALTAEAELVVTTRRGDFAVRKGEYQDLGLTFETPMMSGVRMCANNCEFCFVDQLPRDARASLWVKDDDWRMSLMMGNYVSLTNVSDRELERIAKRHVSPLYISVHAIDPELRARLMGTPRAKKLPGQLKTLAAGGVEFHSQAVLLPGENDGDALEETIRELLKLRPAARSLALVPVGLTGHRAGLPGLRKYTRAEAGAVLDIADRWRARCLDEIGTRFVFPSDEFYLAAGREVPADAEYEDYAQIDDGVGMIRLLQTEYDVAYAALGEAASARNARLRGDERRQPPPGGEARPAKAKIAIATGVSAAPFLSALMKTHPVPGAEIGVYAIRNRFFGESVTVAGLITGGDLISGMAGVACTHVLITECMLRAEDELFLDNLSLSEVSARLGKPVIPVGRRGEDLLGAITDIVEG